MATDQLVCPSCQADVRDAGVLKVETGMTQVQPFYFHPHADAFVADDMTKIDAGDDTSWQCRTCGGNLPREIAEHIETRLEG